MRPLIIFDMDGVLIDSEPLHRHVEGGIFRDLGLAISESEHTAFAGMSPRGMWTAVTERYGLQHDIDALVVRETQIKSREFAAAALRAMPGVEDLIRDLEAAGHDLAVASSSPAELIETITAKLGLRERFSRRVSAEEVARCKPHPGVFLRAASLCGRNPHECVVIEDSFNGVCAAGAAGMQCIGYRNPNSGAQDLSAADLVVEDFGAASRQRIITFADSGVR